MCACRYQIYRGAVKARNYIFWLVGSALVSFGAAVLVVGPLSRLKAAPMERAPVVSVQRQVPRTSRPRQAAGAALKPSPAARPVVVRGVFHADRVVPYFTRGAAAQARARLLRGDLAGATKSLRLALGKRPAHPERLRFVLAHTLMRRRQFADAVDLFLGLRVAYSVLRHEATYYAARCAYHHHQTLLARGLASQVKGPGPFTARARLLLGDTHRSQKQWRLAAQVYAAFLKTHTGAPGEAEALLRLAQSLTQIPGTTTRRIVALLHRADALAPHRVWGKTARALLPRILRRERSAWQRKRLARRTCAGLLQRSRALSRARRIRAAARDLARAQRAGRCRLESLCRAATALGRIQAKKKRYRGTALKTLRVALRTCQRARLSKQQALAKYVAAKVNAALGRTRRALALFRRVEREHPNHSFADDASYRSALVLERQGQTRKAHARLRKLPTRYPEGDMQHNALWRLAWIAYTKAQYNQALLLLEQSWKIRRAAARVENAGRDGYWRARVLARLGRATEALEAYAAVVKRHPLTFYALLSLSRLKTTAPERARKLVAASRARAARRAWRFGPSPVYRRLGFRRAVELARLGLGNLAARELRSLGIRSPKRIPGEPSGSARGSAKTLSKKEQRARLWAAAVLYDRAGLQHKSHWIVRWSLRSYARRPPQGANHARWSISFPRPYAALVRSHAAKSRLPVSLVWGLMREESAFNPRLVSRAKAVGLMQLLRSTAKRFRGGRRPRITLATLKRPALNVPIGTRYLGWLLRLYEGNLVPTVASYNAGETKIFEWIRKRGDLPVDHFIEAIPFRETRYYVKRVLGSAYAYNVLRNTKQPVFDVPRVFSAKLVVKSRHWQRSVKRWTRARRKARRSKRRARRKAKRRVHRKAKRRVRRKAKRRVHRKAKRPTRRRARPRRR
jgi:soluble lytic murein transglycosylase